MYLTAHRVRTDAGREGINVFLHITGYHIDNPSQELAKVEGEPGTLTAASCEIAPGHNQVLCYLDIIAVDDVRAEGLKALYSAGKALLNNEPDQVPFQMTSGNALMRLGCTIGHLHSHRHLTDFDLLWERSMCVLVERPVPSWLGQQASLVIVQQQINDQLIYALDDSSFARVQAIKGPKWLRRRFTVDIFDRMDVEQMQGDITTSIISSITGLELDQIAHMGGVSIIHQRTGRVIAKYP
jgi:hypothetical protein